MTSLVRPAPTALAAPVLFMMSLSLSRHSLLSWPRPSLRTYFTDTLPPLIYKDFVYTVISRYSSSPRLSTPMTLMRTLLSATHVQRERDDVTCSRLFFSSPSSLASLRHSLLPSQRCNYRDVKWFLELLASRETSGYLATFDENAVVAVLFYISRES